MKQNAKRLIRINTPYALLTSFIFCIASYLFSVLSSRIMGMTTTLGELESFFNSQAEVIAQTGSYEGYYRGLAELFAPDIDILSVVICIALSVMLMVLQMGFLSFCLKISRGEQAKPDCLLDGFEIFLKSIGLTIVFDLIVSVLMSLFLIPGIIAALSYSLSFYILLDNPDISIFKAMSRSRKMMKGNKRFLFLMSLSFILWAILSVFFTVPEVYFLPFFFLSLAGLYNSILARSFFAEASFTPKEDEEAQK